MWSVAGFDSRIIRKPVVAHSRRPSKRNRDESILLYVQLQHTQHGSTNPRLSTCVLPSCHGTKSTPFVQAQARPGPAENSHSSHAPKSTPPHPPPQPQAATPHCFSPCCTSTRYLTLLYAHPLSLPHSPPSRNTRADLPLRLCGPGAAPRRRVVQSLEWAFDGHTKAHGD